MLGKDEKWVFGCHPTQFLLFLMQTNGPLIIQDINLLIFNQNLQIKNPSNYRPKGSNCIQWSVLFYQSYEMPWKIFWAFIVHRWKNRGILKRWISSVYDYPNNKFLLLDAQQYVYPQKSRPDVSEVKCWEVIWTIS